MHDKLFQNASALNQEAFVQFAKDLGLNVEKFQADLVDPKTAKRVEEDMALGNKSGVRGTPGFFINGVLLSGAQPLPQFKAVIDRWLSMSK